MTTATMSSSTETPMASWPARSWLRPVSCRIFPMIEDDEIMSIPARNRPSVEFQPSAAARSRDR